GFLANFIIERLKKKSEPRLAKIADKKKIIENLTTRFALISVILMVRYEVFILGSQESVVDIESGYTSSL
ncbi:MAG: hypothetical protein ACKPAE_06550, partial [Microcystis panniformis]